LSSSVNMTIGCRSQPIVETLKNEPILHPMVWTGQDVLLKPFWSLWNRFICCLLETRNPPMKHIGFIQQKELIEECFWTAPCIDSLTVCIEPLLGFLYERKWE
jgi:hypothetical protein